MDVLPTFNRILYGLMKSEKENVWNAAAKRYAFDDQIVHRWSRCFKSPNMPPTRKTCPILYTWNSFLLVFRFSIFNTWDIPAVGLDPKSLGKKTSLIFFDYSFQIVSTLLSYIYNHQQKIFFFIFIPGDCYSLIYIYIHSVYKHGPISSHWLTRCQGPHPKKNCETIKFLENRSFLYYCCVYQYTTVTD